MWQIRQGTEIHQALSLCRIPHLSGFPATAWECWSAAGSLVWGKKGDSGELSIKLRGKGGLLSWDCNFPTLSVLKWPFFFSVMLRPEGHFLMFVFGNTRLIHLMGFFFFVGLVGFAFWFYWPRTSISLGNLICHWVILFGKGILFNTNKNSVK